MKKMERGKEAALTPHELEKLRRGYWEPEFWFGYHRGLNRLRHGNIFGNAEEHRSWSSIPDSLDEEPSIERIAWGIGYRAGYMGMQVEGAAEKIRELMKFLKDNYGVEEV